jgi:hypothetical protein
MAIICLWKSECTRKSTEEFEQQEKITREERYRGLDL